MENQEMNSVYFKDGKIYLNGNRIPYVTDIEIKKHVGDSTNVRIEFLAKVNDLDYVCRSKPKNDGHQMN
jgi:hypothetical protein